MGNIDTYVKDAGRRSFAEEPFNDVDNLIISYLVYYRFKGIVPTPGQKKSISVADAARLYKQTVGDSQKTVQPVLLEDMGRSVRFRDVRISDRIDIFQKGKTQFSALCVTLPDGTPYFVFRGIDYSVTGWKEAFETSYRITPAQIMAAEYLQRILSERLESYTGGILLGGHSKGGNLAIYAAVHQDKKVRDKIRKIYQNDAPGLAPDSYDPAVLKEFKGRVHRLAPEFAVIDSVYKTSQANRILKVEADGLNQHEPFCWVVEGTDFVEVPAPDPKAMDLQNILSRWISSVNAEERRQFVTNVFGFLQKKQDDGTPVHAEKALDVVSLVIAIWQSAARPAKRAMVRLVKAFIEIKIHR